jgi:hypothetical protein
MLDDKDRIFTNIYGIASTSRWLAPCRVATGTAPSRPGKGP